MTSASDSTDNDCDLYVVHNADGNVHFRGGSNGKVLLGRSANKWKEIWCTQSSINSSSDKSFVFIVKDKRLLEITGGIVQGMSGSPIIQDGKLIGAVTHVFLYDPTKGYGVYLDWMLDEVG